MSVSFKRCNNDNKLVPSCASPDEITAWLSKHMVMRLSMEDVLDFQLREGIPMYQKIDPVSLSYLNPYQPQRTDFYLRRNEMYTYDSFLNPTGDTTIEYNFYNVIK